MLNFGKGHKKEIIQALKEDNAGHISVTAGGFIDDESARRIREMGVKAVFPKGTILEELVEWAHNNIKALE